MMNAIITILEAILLLCLFSLGIALVLMTVVCVIEVVEVFFGNEEAPDE